MGREVRMVPKDWEHPKDERGNFVPLFPGARALRELREEWDENERQWLKGLVTDFKGGWKPLEDCPAHIKHYSQWAGLRPDPADYMPDWPESERTHFQMYENTTEGTPISPVMASAEELAQWLADNKASAFGDTTAPYESWLAVIRRG